MILLLSNNPVPFTLSNSMRLSVFIHWILYLEEEFQVPVNNILPLFNVNNWVGLVVPIPTLPFANIVILSELLVAIINGVFS